MNYKTLITKETNKEKISSYRIANLLLDEKDDKINVPAFINTKLKKTRDLTSVYHTTYTARIIIINFAIKNDNGEVEDTVCTIVDNLYDSTILYDIIPYIKEYLNIPENISTDVVGIVTMELSETEDGDLFPIKIEDDGMEIFVIVLFLSFLLTFLYIIFS